MTKLPPLLAIVGPTAAGKTRISIHLAREFDGEVISADSRQVYRGMDIGTAKVEPRLRREIPHHLLDVVDPDEPFSLAEYQELAYRAIADVTERGRLPLLAGGSGLYVRAVLQGWKIPRVEPDPELRESLEAQAVEHGPEWLHRRLAELDPHAAQRIDARNVRRVVRALEVSLIAGKPISELQGKSPPAYRVLRIGLTMPREVLYERIDERVDEMMEQGLVEEMRSLLAGGCSPDLPSMSGLGYRQIGLYLTGEATLTEAVALIKRETRRFVRQQYTWFRLDDPRIHWFEAHRADYALQAEETVKAFLAEGGE